MAVQDSPTKTNRINIKTKMSEIVERMLMWIGLLKATVLN